MYELIETRGGAAGTLATYASLDAATEAMLERARSVARGPSARVLTQRPRKVVFMDGDGARTTVLLRHACRT